MDTNCRFSSSTAWRSDTSRNVWTAPAAAPSMNSGATTISTGNEVPSRRTYTWSGRNASPPVNTSSRTGHSCQGNGVPSGCSWWAMSWNRCPTRSISRHRSIRRAARFANRTKPWRSSPTIPSPAESRTSSVTTRCLSSSDTRMVMRHTARMMMKTAPRESSSVGWLATPQSRMARRLGTASTPSASTIRREVDARSPSARPAVVTTSAVGVVAAAAVAIRAAIRRASST